MAVGVQFWSIEPVLKAFDDRGLETWGLFQAKQFITAGEGRPALQAFLDLVNQGPSSAVYTLRVYKGIDDIDDINDLTPYNGSFNFKLNESAGYVGGGGNAALLARIAALEKEKADRDREDNDDSIKGALIGLLHEPEKIPHLIQGIKMLFGGGNNFIPQLAVGTVPAIRAGEEMPVSSDVRMQRLAAAIDALERNDPKILDHLEALARLSEQNPSFFKMLIGQLDNMK